LIDASVSVSGERCDDLPSSRSTITIRLPGIAVVMPGTPFELMAMLKDAAVTVQPVTGDWRC